MTLYNAPNTDYEDADYERVFAVAPIVLFREYCLTTSCGKYSQSFAYVHGVCLMYNIKTSSKDINDLLIGFYGNNARRKLELAIQEEAPGEG